MNAEEALQILEYEAERSVNEFAIGDSETKQGLAEVAEAVAVIRAAIEEDR